MVTQSKSTIKTIKCTESVTQTVEPDQEHTTKESSDLITLIINSPIVCVLVLCIVFLLLILISRSTRLALKREDEPKWNDQIEALNKLQTDLDN